MRSPEAAPTDGAPDPRPLTIVVVGATGAVGSDLLSVLHRSALPVGELRLVASPSSAGESVEVDGVRHRVHVLSGPPESMPVFEEADLVFLAVPPDVAREIGPAIAELGPMVVDIGGNLAGLAPLVVPAVNMDALVDGAREGIVSSPSAPAVLVSTVVAALRDLVPLRVGGTLLLSAGLAGRDGAAELSAQVVAMFNQKDPPRKVFPTGLAFDLQTSVGTVPRAPEGEADPLEGWTDAERRLAAEVAVLTGLPPTRVVLDLAVAPTFSGLSASLLIELEAPLDDGTDGTGLDEVRARLAEAPTIRQQDPVPGPRRLVGHAGAYVGRVRRDPSGNAVHLWAVADNLRFAAVGNAIAIATALWRDGRL
ncbi:MAG: hypothetical protein H6742_07240 [Alphaproteobacteria bacterium]|nr:hypothetical protein [Alphaproteobacteria bacterium]